MFKMGSIKISAATGNLLLLTFVLPFLGWYDVKILGFLPPWNMLWLSFPLFLMTTAFLHRYFSHRAFELYRPWEILMSFICASLFQYDPAWWANIHRKHHRDADTPLDPHSAHSKPFLEAVFLWPYHADALITEEALVADLLAKPDLRFYNRYPYFAPFVFGSMLFWLLYFWLGNQDLKWTFHLWLWFYPIPCANTFIWNNIANFILHSFGHQDHDTGEKSKNSFLFGIFFWGEGWHNNHHKFPNRASNSQKWWQIDLTYWFICLLKFLRIAKKVN